MFYNVQILALLDLHTWSMHMPLSVTGFESHLLNDIRVEHGQPLGDEGQAAHACKDLQRWLDGVGLQQGLIGGGVQTVFTGRHWFVLRTAVQHITVIHCKESKERTCCMFMHCLTYWTLYLFEICEEKYLLSIHTWPVSDQHGSVACFDFCCFSVVGFFHCLI